MKITLKKIVATTLALSLVVVLAACGSSDNPAPSSDSIAPATSGGGNLKPLVVGASPSPHAEILEAARADLADLGYDLQIKEFTDYVMPNKALDGGELDANFFQHKPYLDVFNAENKTDIVSVATVHFEPLGFYLGKGEGDAATLAGNLGTLVDSIKDGAEIAIPNDEANGARGLQLLQKIGLITLPDGIGLKATPKDIIDNPKNIKVTQLEAAQIPRAIDDVDFAVINGNYAIDAGVVDRLITTEDNDSEGALTFANIIAVRADSAEAPETKALVQALHSEVVRQYIEEKYSPLAFPVF